ncbi:DUF397 domain-containing protein [Catellatospora bangladeshensis]
MSEHRASPHFRKSTRCNPEGGCVEVARTDGAPWSATPRTPTARC